MSESVNKDSLRESEGQTEAGVERRRFLARAAAIGVGALAVPAAYAQQTGPGGDAVTRSGVSGDTASGTDPASPTRAGASALANLGTLTRGVRSRRTSSYDRTGGNKDNLTIAAGETATIADIKGAGTIRHIWSTCRIDNNNLRGLVLRIYWDGEETPSVVSPLGDFFGLGHARPNYYASAPMTASYLSMNSFWAMPFANGAKLTVTNDSKIDAVLYFYIDYHEYDAAPADTTRFHCSFRRTLLGTPSGPNPTPRNARAATGPATPPPAPELNTTGKDNLVILDVEGRGHYVGCFLHLDTDQLGWWGEGDDFFVIDGEPLPPRLHGTGMEDYFCGAWNYNTLLETYSTPYHGYTFRGNADYTGKHSQYRFHIEDPIFFDKSLHFSIEHGHNNDRTGDWTTTAYWYQVGRTKPLPDVGSWDDRLPYSHGGLERHYGMKDRAGLPR